MAYVPMNRTRALIICTRPQDYDPARRDKRLWTRDLLSSNWRQPGHQDAPRPGALAGLGYEHQTDILTFF